MEIVRNSDGTLVVPVQLGRQHETDNETRNETDTGPPGPRARELGVLGS